MSLKDAQLTDNNVHQLTKVNTMLNKIDLSKEKPKLTAITDAYTDGGDVCVDFEVNGVPCFYTFNWEWMVDELLAEHSTAEEAIRYLNPED